MKSTIKIILIVVLFSSVVTADEGNMGSGGRTCTPTPTTTCPARSIDAGDTNNGETSGSLAVFEYIRNYLFSIFE